MAFAIEPGTQGKFLPRDSTRHWGDIQPVYIHMFAFRWKSDVIPEQVQRAKFEIHGLQGQIPGLLETAVGVNISPRGQGYEFGGLMKCR
jgi:hypothetical protein